MWSSVSCTSVEDRFEQDPDLVEGPGRPVPAPRRFEPPMAPAPTVDALGVDVVWTANAPASRVRVRVHDPEGRTDWLLGIAETGAGRRGWYGEDCFVGMGPHLYCHPFRGSTLTLDAVRTPAEVSNAKTTLLQSGEQLTFVLQDQARTTCWTWGHDPTYYAPMGCQPLPVPRVRWARRAGCSGLDPADPAPLGGAVALTFDDGPDVLVTPRILATLRKHEVPATFFMVGERVADPAAWPIVDEIVADPLFEVGNHSWDHADQASLRAPTALDQTQRTDDLLRTFGAVPSFYRFPYGRSSCRTADQVRAEGYRVAGWHVDTADWCYAWTGGRCSRSAYWRVSEIFERDMQGFVMHQVRRFGGGVLLLHDIHAYTADQLEPLVLALKAEGYRFVGLDDAEAFPRANRGEPFDFPWMGERCDPASDRCWEVEPEAWCERLSEGTDQGLCTVACTDSCVERDGTAPLWCAPRPEGGGACVGQALGVNDHCGAIPGTVAASLPRFDDGAPEATVCVPPSWTSP
ncbi:MAG: polysaccharide deacetylase family protein [Myxococcales bacterium]|nr:polysaccharide deacetylase family protein [Myxococcales bacterium]